MNPHIVNHNYIQVDRHHLHINNRLQIKIEKKINQQEIKDTIIENP